MSHPTSRVLAQGASESPGRSTRRPSWLALGISGALLTFGGLALWFILVYPAFLSADEVFHLDHAWRVGHGELPELDDGITAPGLPAAGEQSTFQHPPLFYALLAPVVTPLLDQGRWRAAVMLGRVTVLVLGTTTVLAVAWATNRLVRTPDPQLVVGAVGTAAVVTPLIGVSAAIYNDLAAVLAATVALGLAATILRRGPTIGRLSGLAAVCAGGFASRASFAVVIVAVALAAAIAAARQRTGRPTTVRVVAGAVSAAVVVLVPLAVSAWFYARNVRLTGNWTGGVPEVAEALLGRERRGLLEVIIDLGVWARGIGGLVAQPVDPAEEPLWPARVGAFVVVLTISALAVHRAIRRFRNGGVEITDVLVGSLLGLVVLGTVGQLALHVANGGGANARYLLLAVLPICVGLAYGLLAPRRARGTLLAGFVAVSVVLLLWQSGRVLQLRRFGRSASLWEAWTSGLASNGIPTFILPGLLGVLLTGFGLLTLALWRLTEAGQGSTDGDE